MNGIVNHINELDASEAFSKQAAVFDQLYGSDETIRYKRERVRKHVLQYLHPHSLILELNCGTGEDAVFFAQKGHYVHATDIADGMLHQLGEKLHVLQGAGQISFELCSFTKLQTLKNQGPFDHVFSNFGGLNCTNELDKVIQTFSSLLKPGGGVTLVIITKFCLWETLLVFKRKFKTAFRRFFSSKGRRAHVEGTHFTCWYYYPSYIIKHLKKDFDVLSIEGLCSLVPPSYIQDFAQKHPKLFSFLKNKEDKWAGKWPWKYIGDYYIISLKKRL